jgi:hypothetical protein
MPVADNLHVREETVSDLANALQAVVLLAADLDRQLRDTRWRGDVASLRLGLSRAMAAALRLIAELRPNE